MTWISVRVWVQKKLVKSDFFGLWKLVKNSQIPKGSSTTNDMQGLNVRRKASETTFVRKIRTFNVDKIDYRRYCNQNKIELLETLEKYNKIIFVLRLYC